jgi:hypothetical protein
LKCWWGVILFAAALPGQRVRGELCLSVLDDTTSTIEAFGSLPSQAIPEAPVEGDKRKQDGRTPKQVLKENIYAGLRAS